MALDLHNEVGQAESKWLARGFVEATTWVLQESDQLNPTRLCQLLPPFFSSCAKVSLLPHKSLPSTLGGCLC